MSENRDISDLIEQYLILIKDSHHKIKDGYFWIEKNWSGYDDQIIPKYTAMHTGYLNELHGPNRYTEKAAEEDMRQFLIDIINDWKEREKEEF